MSIVDKETSRQVAECTECEWSAEDNALGRAQHHASETGHAVTAEIEHSYEWNTDE